jgi:hypothetical protein
MKSIISFIALLIFSSLSFAEENIQEQDLSGAWRFTTSENGQRSQYDVLLIKTMLNIEGDSFYQVIGKAFGYDFVGMRIRKRPDNGLWHFSWYMFRGPNELNVNGTRLDGEETIVLEITDNFKTFVLGGDYGPEEVARLTRLSWFYEPTPALLPEANN